jgi:hypothetical protein
MTADLNDNRPEHHNLPVVLCIIFLSSSRAWLPFISDYPSVLVSPKAYLSC